MRKGLARVVNGGACALLIIELIGFVCWYLDKANTKTGARETKPMKAHFRLTAGTNLCNNKTTPAPTSA